MKIIGHRGAKGLAPENTLQGFAKALEHHVDEIELDVHVTKDHKTVLVHDPFLADESGNQLTIANATFAELQQHKPGLIGLEKALRFIDRRVPVVIEVKPDTPTKQTISIVRRLLLEGWKPSDLRFASFEQRILRELYAAFPEITIVVNETWSGTRAVLRAREVNTKRLCMRDTWLWRGFLGPMQRRGYEISPYTINDPKKARKWAPYLYGVVTDRPDLFEK